jgi:putative endonuclease
VLSSDRAKLARFGEDLAAAQLVANGFAVRFRNLRLGPLELDLVATRGDLAVVVEVRARSARSFQKPLASLSPRKCDALRRALHALWRAHLVGDPHIQRLRLDVAAITRCPDGSTSVEWVAGALTGDAGHGFP